MSPDRPICFIDLEATSLEALSTPIELGWSATDGQTGSCLIRPQPDWTDWSADSEAMHGISRVDLQGGLPVAEVAVLVRVMAHHYALVSDAPLADAKWLALILDAGGGRVGDTPVEPPHVFEAQEVAWMEANRLLGIEPSYFAPGEVTELRQQLISERSRRLHADDGIRHRAQADAERLHRAHRALSEQVTAVITQKLNGRS